MMTLTARLCAMCAVSALLQLALPDGRMRGGLRVVSGLLMLRLTLGGAAALMGELDGQRDLAAMLESLMR